MEIAAPSSTIARSLTKLRERVRQEQAALTEAAARRSFAQIQRSPVRTDGDRKRVPTWDGPREESAAVRRVRRALERLNASV
jgi:hypothetical protein